MIKNIPSIFISLSFFALITNSTIAQQGEWTWMSGDSINGTAVWGTQGVPSVNNKPPGLYESIAWTDHDGNFWLFGGVNNSSQYSALWKYDPLAGTWTWVKGPNTSNQVGTYGTMGMPSPANNPGARGWGGYAWVDTSNQLWLYGGWGYGSTGGSGALSDLWVYNIVTNEWTWMNGNTSISVPPVYGTFHVFASNVNPGMRIEGESSWIGADNNLWLYGGETNSYGSQHASMFRYDPSINQWAWWNGSTSLTQAAVFGTVGVFDTLNTPGSRQAYSEWQDANGLFWFYGGKVTGNNAYADLWAYDPSANKWAFMGGSMQANNSGVAGNKCEDSSLYYPANRYENKATWKDVCGNFWMLDGTTISSLAGYNGLWCYVPSLKKWTWTSGSLTSGATGFYGTKSVSSPYNKPTGRFGANSYTDKDGNLWLFGGWLAYSSNYYGNDLWKYVIDPNCPAANACAVAPVATFLSSDTLFCASTCVDFFDFSTGNPTSWQWSFPGGNPSSSALQNPTNICYPSAGTYDVTLIVTNNTGSDTIVISSFITVNSAPAVTVIQSNDTLYSSAGNSYQWYTGGNPINGATDDFYVPSTEDFYSVVITDANGCTAADTIFFSLSPQTSFAASDTTICQKFCMDFFDQSGNNPTTWQWSFPGGVPSSSNQQNPTQICYNNPGVYDVTLITTNPFGSDTLVLAGYITVYSTPPFPTITINGYVLTSSYASSYQWQFNSLDIPGATNQSYTATQTGYYTVIITDENGCVSSTTVYVEVTGIESFGSDPRFLVYPNPSNGNFIVEFSGSNWSKLISIEVVNTIGQRLITFDEIISASDWKKEISLKGISPGVYFLGITSENISLKKKIIITQ